MADILEQLAALREHETRVAMATLIGARGGSPRPLGAKLFVGEGGRLLGSVSIGGCGDARVGGHGERLLKGNRAQGGTGADALVLVGGRDVGGALAKRGRALGMKVVVVGGRGRNGPRDRFATADEILVGMPSDLARPHFKQGSYVVLAAHEYKYELPILREALRAPVRYVGMLAGRKRADAVRTILREEGLTEE